VRLKSTIAVLMLAAAAVVGLSSILVSVDHRLAAQQIRLEAQIVLAERQAERLEAVLRRLEGVTSPSSITEGAGGKVKHAPRAAADPTQQIHPPPTPGADVGAQFRPGPAPGGATPHRRESASNAPQRGLALVATFETESNSSEWGKRTADEITRAYEAEPFFARFDGALTTDCRVTTCLVTWSVPVADPNDPELAMAKYELMALAAQKEQPVRRMQSVRHTEKGRTIIQFYVAR
jgi:hypothetical protein